MCLCTKTQVVLVEKKKKSGDELGRRRCREHLLYNVSGFRFFSSLISFYQFRKLTSLAGRTKIELELERSIFVFRKREDEEVIIERNEAK